jgi:hypothetical protein
MKKTIMLAGAMAMLSGVALADHGNPWATEDDVVLSCYHEENQARSIDTPGEDEMRGRTVRSASGKLGGGQSGGKSAGAGRTGGGGAKSGGGQGGGGKHRR